MAAIPYANKSGRSGCTHYELGAASITVTFRGGRRYAYTDQSAGRQAIGTMKLLARGGKGLCTYIARNKPAYSRKF